MEDGLADCSPVPSDTDMLLLSAGLPMSKREMLGLLPPRPDADRLVRRYFGASSPTQSRWCVWKGCWICCADDVPGVQSSSINLRL